MRVLVYTLTCCRKRAVEGASLYSHAAGGGRLRVLVDTHMLQEEGG